MLMTRLTNNVSSTSGGGQLTDKIVSYISNHARLDVATTDGFGRLWLDRLLPDGGRPAFGNAGGHMLGDPPQKAR